VQSTGGFECPAVPAGNPHYRSVRGASAGQSRPPCAIRAFPTRRPRRLAASRTAGPRAGPGETPPGRRITARPGGRSVGVAGPGPDRSAASGWKVKELGGLGQEHQVVLTCQPPPDLGVGRSTVSLVTRPRARSANHTSARRLAPTATWWRPRSSITGSATVGPIQPMKYHFESAWDPRRLHTLEVRMEHDQRNTLPRRGTRLSCGSARSAWPVMRSPHRAASRLGW